MKLLFISAVDKAETWREAMLNELPELEFRVWPDEAEPRDDVDYALVWRPPHGVLKTYPNLKAILSLGAGIDSILSDPELPRHLPIVRLVDRCLTEGMSEYVIYWVLHYHRHMGKYSRMVADGKWRTLPQYDTRLRRVGRRTGLAAELDDRVRHDRGWADHARRRRGGRGRGRRQRRPRPDPAERQDGERSDRQLLPDVHVSSSVAGAGHRQAPGCARVAVGTLSGSGNTAR